MNGPCRSDHTQRHGIRSFDLPLQSALSRTDRRLGFASRRSPACASATAESASQVLLSSEGWEIQIEEDARIYNELGLQDCASRRSGEKVMRPCATIVAQLPHHNDSAMDFVHDQVATGQKVRVLDNRFAIQPDFAASARSKVQRARRRRRRDLKSAPVRQRIAVVDLESPGNRVRLGRDPRALDLCDSSSPSDFSLAEFLPATPSSSRSMGASKMECLRSHWFLTRADAREKLEDWPNCVNEDRPHGALLDT